MGKVSSRRTFKFIARQVYKSHKCLQNVIQKEKSKNAVCQGFPVIFRKWLEGQRDMSRSTRQKELEVQPES